MKAMEANVIGAGLAGLSPEAAWAAVTGRDRRFDGVWRGLCGPIHHHPTHQNQAATNSYEQVPNLHADASLQVSQSL